MYAKVMPNQFRVKDDSIIHTPTGAEFTQVAAESMVVWTGDIGRALPIWGSLLLRRRARDDETGVAGNSLRLLVSEF